MPELVVKETIRGAVVWKGQNHLVRLSEHIGSDISERTKLLIETFLDQAGFFANYDTAKESRWGFIEIVAISPALRGARPLGLVDRAHVFPRISCAPDLDKPDSIIVRIQPERPEFLPEGDLWGKLAAFNAPFLAEHGSNKATPLKNNTLRRSESTSHTRPRSVMRGYAAAH